MGRLEKRLARPLPRPGGLRPKARSRDQPNKEERLSGLGGQIKEYIAAGDIFQAVLSQRFEVKPGVDPFSIYRALRIVNPSPYLYFLRFGPENGQVCHTFNRTSNNLPSPGGLLSRIAGARQQRHVEYRPIAGTRPRSANEEEDLRIEQELLADEKERAEHVMLVDLGRNDVGRVCEFGSVRVEEPDVCRTLFARHAPGQRH